MSTLGFKRFSKPHVLKDIERHLLGQVFAQFKDDLDEKQIVSAAKRAWARLIKQVYEIDPLVCPRCTGPMRIIAFIEQPEVIRKILTLAA